MEIQFSFSFVYLRQQRVLWKHNSVLVLYICDNGEYYGNIIQF